GGGAAVSYLRFSKLDPLARQGLARQNRVVAGRRYATDFRELDAHLGARHHAGRWRLSAGADVARNLAATNDRDAVRTRLAVGGAGAPASVELGWIYQRIERDAVPG